MATEAFLLQASVGCPGCHGKIHLQGLAKESTCASCATSFVIPDDQWASWFGEMLGDALASPTQQASMTELGGTGATCVLGKVSPRCTACEADLPLQRLEDDAARGYLQCGCGESISIRPAPALAGRLIPGARWLIGEGPLSGGTPSQRTEPIALTCVSCAASLPVDGSKRAVPCPYCSATNYLPDAVWFRLHPPQKARSFFVLAEWDAHTRLSVLAEYDPERISEAADLPAEILLKLAASHDWTARRNVARHPDLPPEAMKRLAEDEDSDVQEALAENPSATPEVLALLAKSGDSDVRARVAGNPATEEAVLRALCQDSSYDVREAVVANPSLPAEALLPWLALEEDSDVQQAALSRADLPFALLRAWAMHDSWDRRPALVARYRGTPPELLRQLAKAEDNDVLSALLQREDLDARTILTLAAASDPKVAELARMHAAYAPAARARLKRRLLIAAVLLVLLGCAGAIAGGIGAVALAIQQLGLL